MSSERGASSLIIALSTCASLLIAGTASAAPELVVSPTTCVSLYRDQLCHQRISIRWSPLPPGRYCLFVDDHEEFLVCWLGANETSHEHVFKSVGDRQYSLVRTGEKAALATVIVERAWVYRGEADSAGGWRLF